MLAMTASVSFWTKLLANSWGVLLTLVRHRAMSRRPLSICASSDWLVSSMISNDICGWMLASCDTAFISNGTAPMIAPTANRPPTPRRIASRSCRRFAISVCTTRA
ncbi:hypothetical protein D9M71_792110 [compost metagenome]